MIEAFLGPRDWKVHDTLWVLGFTQQKILRASIEFKVKVKF